MKQPVSEFRDMDHFLSKAEFLHYINSSYFEKSYLLKYDPEKKRRAKKEYWNIPCSFDIETTSFYTPDGEKAATMYLWGFNLNGRSIYGRTWEEFLALLELLHDVMNTENIRLIIWVHNLSYEFCFMHRWIEWEEVFCLKDHEVAKALTTSGIEFRCSLLESGKRLALLAEDCKENPIEKLDTLEYRGMRHSKTPLTDLELMYQLNDVRVVSNYIYEKGKRRRYGIPNILMTKTGYVREFLRSRTVNAPDRNTRQHFRNWMKELTLDPMEYLQARKTFQGGYVHGNALYINEVLKFLAFFDGCSQYPAMFTNLFPMSKGKYFAEPDEDTIKETLERCLSMFTWEVWGLKRRPDCYDDPISESHCEELKGAVINNGRVKKAEHLITNITNIDFEVYQKYYTWDRMSITNLWRYMKGYLPKPIIESVLELYRDKTTLKGVESMEELYVLQKENINSLYGCMVMAVIRTLVEYVNGDFVETEPDPVKEIEKYNKSKSRFTWYIHGLFITSYARAAILGIIKECGKDYAYSDTDSCEIINWKKHLHVFREYNIRIRERHYKCLDYYGLDHELVEPRTVKGKKKLLGAFECERVVERFKCLGAKRYMWQKGDKYMLTVAGLGKQAGMDYIISEAAEYEELEVEERVDPDDVFEVFTDDLSVPPEETGKLTHTYIDYEIDTELTDMFGQTERVYEKSCIHLEPCPFHLSLSKQFIEFLSGINDGYGLYGG